MTSPERNCTYCIYYYCEKSTVMLLSFLLSVRETIELRTVKMYLVTVSQTTQSVRNSIPAGMHALSCFAREHTYDYSRQRRRIYIGPE